LVVRACTIHPRFVLGRRPGGATGPSISFLAPRSGFNGYLGT